jgi:hypothetical protein
MAGANVAQTVNPTGAHSLPRRWCSDDSPLVVYACHSITCAWVACAAARLCYSCDGVLTLSLPRDARDTS